MEKLILDRNTALLLRCEMVKYLDGCGYMKMLQEEVMKYNRILKDNRTRFPPFNFPIYLDHMDLLDKSGNTIEYFDSIMIKACLS